MEILQTSIISVIKAIRSSKKRADELSVYKFIRKGLQPITNEDINDTENIMRIEINRK